MVKYRCTEYFAVGWTDPRGIFGTTENGPTVILGVEMTQKEMWARGYCPILNKLYEENK